MYLATRRGYISRYTGLFDLKVHKNLLYARARTHMQTASSQHAHRLVPHMHKNNHTHGWTQKRFERTLVWSHFGPAQFGTAEFPARPANRPHFTVVTPTRLQQPVLVGLLLRGGNLHSSVTIRPRGLAVARKGDLRG